MKKDLKSLLKVLAVLGATALLEVLKSKLQESPPALPSGPGSSLNE